MVLSNVAFGAKNNTLNNCKKNFYTYSERSIPALYNAVKTNFVTRALSSGSPVQI
jgi:hypothetical protein